MDMIYSLTSLFSQDLGNEACAFVMQGTSGLLAGEYYVDSRGRATHPTEIFTDRAEDENWLLSC